jgi:hypothetical protein
MEAMYLSIVNDVELAEQMWDELPGVLKLVVVFRHYHELAERPELAERLDRILGSMKPTESDDEALAAMVKTVIHDYVYPELSGFSFDHN